MTSDLRFLYGCMLNHAYKMDVKQRRMGEGYKIDLAVKSGQTVGLKILILSPNKEANINKLDIPQE